MIATDPTKPNRPGRRATKPIPPIVDLGQWPEVRHAMSIILAADYPSIVADLNGRDDAIRKAARGLFRETSIRLNILRKDTNP